MPALAASPVPPTPPRASAPTVRQETWESANRRGLLYVHGFIGLMAGTLILFNKTAGTFEEISLYARPLTGLLALVGGALLVTGLAAGRRIGVEIAGLSVLAVWDLLMAAGFVIAAQRVGALSIDWPWVLAAKPEAATMYPIVIYVGLFLMMCLHLLTLTQIRPARPAPVSPRVTQLRVLR